jgi:hypothetical protein
LLHIVAGAEGRIRPRDHDATSLGTAHRLLELIVQGEGQRIARFGPIQREDQDFPIPIDTEFGSVRVVRGDG